MSISLTAAPQLEVLRSLFAGAEVRSFVPGRIRLRFERLPEVLREPRWLSEILPLRQVEVGLDTGSVLLRYDRHKVPDPLLRQVLPLLGIDASRFDKVIEQVPPPKKLVADAWTVKNRLPGRIRLEHPGLRRAVVAKRIELLLLGLDGVKHFSISEPTSTVLVYHHPTLAADDLLATLRETISYLEEEREGGELVENPAEIDQSMIHLTASSFSLAVAITSIAVPVVRPLAAVLTALASLPIFKKAIEALVVHRKVKVDILDAVVIGLALRYRFVFAGALMVWVVDVADVLLDRSNRASRELLTEVFGRKTRRATLWIDGREVPTDVSKVQVGDRVLVRSGEQIPVDGVIVEGEAMVDQHALTGEFAPVERAAGEPIFAMTVVLAGRLVVEATQTGGETRAAQIVRFIEQSVEHKVRLQTLSEYFADIMVVPTLGLGALGYSYAGPGAMMAIINSDFGTGIRIAGPLAMLSSLSVAARNGILVKNGAALEQMQKLDAIIFDKTGTLTEDVPMIGRIVSDDPAFPPDRLLAWIASAERRFTHPIARAILEKATELNLELPEFESSSYHVGFGIEVEIEGEKVRVGSRRYLAGEGIVVPGRLEALLEDIHQHGGTAIFAAVGERLVGVLELRAGARPEGYRIVQTLREKRGIQDIYLISGDHRAATEALAKRLGIEKFFAEVLPDEKARYVRQLKAEGKRVAMVGDGINDSVALTQADLSISLRGAADIATDVADIVLMDGNLAKFDLLFDLSANLRRNVQRSFALTVVPNSLCIGAAMFGLAGLGTSLITNNFFNLVVTLNGMLPLYALRHETIEADLALDREKAHEDRQNMAAIHLGANT